MNRKQRVRGDKPTDENPLGRFEIEDIDDEGEIVEDVPEVEPPATGIVVHYHEPVFNFHAGREIIRSGGHQKRVFSPETHGKDWKKRADEFIATCQLQDGERRPRYISHEEF